MAQQAIFRLSVVCGGLWLAGCAQTPAVSDAQAGPALAPMSAQNLMGSTPSILNAEFGQPVLRRVDGTAQVWLYHSAVCGLNLILYPDHAGMPRVAAAVPDNGDPARCMASLQRSLTDAANNAAMEHPAPS